MSRAVPDEFQNLVPTFAAIAVAALLTGVFALPAGAVGIERIELLQQSVKTSGQSFVTGWGIRAHLSGGDLNDPFAIVPAIERWNKIVRLPELGVAEAQQGDWRIGADFRYRFGDRTGWTPYAGVGLALDIVDRRVEIGPQYTTPEVRTDSSRDLAPSFQLGIDLPASGPIRSAFELNYNLVPDLKQFKINFGIGYQFGNHEKPISQ